MTLANMRGLHDPVRSEREAQLERRVAELEACLTWALADIEGRAVTTPGQRAAGLSRSHAALSTTASRGGDDEQP